MKTLFVLVNYSRSPNKEEFNEITIYKNYKKAKKRYEKITSILKTMEFDNKKTYEYEVGECYTAFDDDGHKDGVYIKEIKINEPCEITIGYPYM